MEDGEEGAAAAAAAAARARRARRRGGAATAGAVAAPSVPDAREADAVARIHGALDRVLMERCGVRAVGGVCGRERGEHLVFDAVAEDRVLVHLLGRRWSLAYRREKVVALWGAGRCAWAIRARRAGVGGRWWRGVGTQSVSAALPLGVSGIAKMRRCAGPSPTGGGNSSELPGVTSRES